MPRRGENIYKRKDGRWEGRLLKSDGKYQYIYAKSYREVKEKRSRALEYVKPKTENNATEAFGASGLFLNWLEGDVINRVKTSTYESYYRCIQLYVIPYFRGMKKDVINELSVAQFTQSIYEKKSLSESYKKKIIIIFKVALKEILKDSENAESVLKAVKTPATSYSSVDVFSVPEQRLIEAEARKMSDNRALGILLCFYTGIRLGELCALKWKNINLETGIMSVVQTVSRTKSFQGIESKTVLAESTPKSCHSIREIPLTCFLTELLLELKQEEDKYVFSGKYTPPDPRSFQRLFKKILNSAGVKERKFHAIRHTFATRALEAGVDIKTLSEILGHSSAVITLRVYAHSLMEHKIVAMSKLNNLYISSIGIDPFAVADAVRQTKIHWNSKHI